MGNKRFWLGMLVMTLVFGMTVVSCEEDEYSPGKVKITNGTTLNIKLVNFETDAGIPVKSDPAGIPSNSSKVYEFDNFTGNVIVTVNINSEDVTIKTRTYANGYTGKPGTRGTRDEVLLSGTNKETLKLVSTGNSFD